MEQTEAFHLLASADRQYAVHELVATSGETTVKDLSRRVAARRHKTSPEKLSDAKIEQARLRLVHTHLPRLTENKIVSVDWNDEEVALIDGPAGDLIETAEELDEWPPEGQLKHPQ